MTEEKVTSIFGGPVVCSNEPVPHIVDTLEGMLNRAKAGEIRAIAIVYVRGNGRPSTIKQTSDLDKDTIWPLHSGLMCLTAKVTDELNGNTYEVDPLEDEDITE